MVARLTEIIFDATDPPTLAAFWAAVLGWDGPTVDDDGEAEITDPSGALPPILFEPTGDPKPAPKNRLHLDVNPVGRPQAEELERLLALGAVHVDVGQHDVDWFVLADPEGNEFCLLHSTVD